MFYNRGVSFNTPKFERALSGYQSRGRTTIIQQNNYGVGSGMFGVGMPPILQPKVGFLGGLGVALGTALNRMFGGMGCMDGMGAMGGMGMIGGYPCIGGIGGAKAQGNEQQSDEQIAANLMRAYPDYNITQGKGGWILTSKDGKETFLDKATIGQVQDEIVKRSKNNKNAPKAETQKTETPKEEPKSEVWTDEKIAEKAKKDGYTKLENGNWSKDGKEYVFKDGEFKPKDSKPAADTQGANGANGTNGANGAEPKDNKNTTIDASKFTGDYIVPNGEKFDDFIGDMLKHLKLDDNKDNRKAAEDAFKKANGDIVRARGNTRYLLVGKTVKVPAGMLSIATDPNLEVKKWQEAVAKRHS